METLKTIWDFFQNEVLGMNWLNRLIETFLNACGLDTTGKIGGSVQFFIYDTIKIMVLLGVLILIISYIQSYFPPERSRKIMGRFHGIWANLIGALLGTVTPFCSCSSIPIFMGFTRIYFMVHYASDVVGALFVGIVCSTCSYFTFKGISKFKFIDKAYNLPSIVSLFKREA